MWVNPLLQALIGAAQSEQTSRAIRVICTILVSLLFLIGIASLFLLVFVIEGQSILQRGVYLLLELGILAYYLHFLRTVIGRRKRGKKP